MEIQSTRQPYEAPAVEIVPVRSEGIICGSGRLNSPDNYNDGGDPFAF